MLSPTAYLVSLLKDTCLLVVIAYLLSRGGLLRLLFRDRLTLRQNALLGCVLGLVGVAVSLIPGDPFKFGTHTLFTTFATFVGGWPVGAITAVIVSLPVAFDAVNRRLMIGTLLAVPLCALVKRAIGRAPTVPMRLLCGFIAGAMAQAVRVLVHDVFQRYWHIPPVPALGLLSIPANGFGVALLLLVISDAQVRAESEARRLEVERHRLDAERSRGLASAAQLAALRARVHPHFMFNALNSIAELCCIAPPRAEIASVNLSRLMRRALDTGASTQSTVRDELSIVHAYLQIEQERLGNRLCVDLDIDPTCEYVGLVPFSVQLLVENAVNHGLAHHVDGGTITVTVRRSARRIVVAVQDNGIGMTGAERNRVLRTGGSGAHGLSILDEQLRILYGHRARLRLFSAEGCGTLAAFALPAQRSLSEGARR